MQGIVCKNFIYGVFFAENLNMQGISNNSTIGQIFKAGVDFVSTVRNQGVCKGICQLGNSFFNLCKTKSANMSSQFYLTKRNAQKSISSFSSTKCLTNTSTLVDDTISELKNMKGIKNNVIKFLKTGKSGGHCFFEPNSSRQEVYVRNVLLNTLKNNNKIEVKVYNALKNNPLIGTKIYQDLSNNQKESFIEKLKISNPTVQQFETFYAKITDPKNPIKTMEAFNEALKML